MIKTNVMRLLEQANIKYESKEYEVDESDLSGVHVASQIGIPMEQVFKTLVAKGNIRGGCSPIGMKKKFPTFIDETAILFDTITISAGVRGCQIIINPEELREYIDASFCELTD